MKKNIYDNYLSKFSGHDKELLKKYFKSLNDKIDLTRKETKLINGDFYNAIMYYYYNGYPLSKILSILSLSNLGTCYKETPNYWYPLDNAAKIYPLSMKDNWMSVFRVSYYLKDNVIPEIFQIALLFTMKRFPTFRTSIRKGFFWHYIDGIKKRFHIYEDKLLPCSYINVSNVGKQSFKAVYYKNRISVEYFHILTDGYGGVVFLSTLVSTYLNLLGSTISYNDIVLDINKHYLQEEVTDSFITKRNNNKTKSLVDSKALSTDGKLSQIRPCQIIHFDMKLQELKELSHSKGVTLTELILGYIFIVLSYSTSKSGFIKIQVPINIRKYHPSSTLRNFALYAVISINKNDITSLDEVLKEIHKQMLNKNNQKILDETMTYTNRLVNSLRFIPLFIKRPIASVVYGFLGDKVLTSVLSNLGNIDPPSEMVKKIDKMDFVLGTGITNRVLFSMITCNNIVTLTISKNTTNSAIENNLYNILRQNNLNVKVHGSEVYENRK